MMKKQTIFLIALLFSCGIFGQEHADTASVGRSRNKVLEFSAGYAQPLGMFASRESNEKKAGFAKPGWLARVSFELMGRSWFGLAMQYTFQRNAMDDSAVLMNPGWPAGEPAGAWMNHFLMLGPVFNINFSKLNVNARLLGGGVISSGTLFYTRDLTDTTAVTFDKNMGTGFACGVSAGIGYDLLPALALKLNLGLLGGWPAMKRQNGSELIGYEEYKDPVTGIINTRPVYSAPVTYEIKKVVTSFNVSLGICFKF